MKINKLLISFLICAFIIAFSNQTILSQPILTRITYPNIGTEIDYYDCDTNNISIGTSGPNVIWDFSTLNINYPDTSIIQIPLEYFGNSSNTECGSYFPSSNLYEKIPGSPFYNYRYYYSSLSTLRCLGFCYQDVNGSGSWIMNNPEIIMNFPFNYTDSFADSFSGNYYRYNDSFLRYGDITSTYDAYGSVILPNHVIDSVIRIHSILIQKDSLISGSGNGHIYSYDKYEWFKEGHLGPFFTFAQVTDSDYPVTYTYEYKYAMVLKDTLFVGINELSKSETNFKLYPNPATDKIILDYSDNREMNISLYSLIGDLVLHRDMSYGTNEIDISSLSKGIYIIKITSADWIVQRKFIKD